MCMDTRSIACRMLPCVMEQQDCDPEVQLRLLVVHVRAASLLSRFDHEVMKIRLKHGQPRVSSACETVAVLFDRELVFRCMPKFPLVADFDTFCVFLWQGSSLRIRLVAVSGKDRVIAKAVVPLGDAVGLQEFDLQLAGLPGLLTPSEEVVGHVSVATEIHNMSRRDLLQHLQRLHAQRRQGAFVLAEVPLGEIYGPCEEAEQEEDLVSVMPVVPVNV
ncbi:unnamed protein product [Prorocentrum cordatum]|uniref:Uncharacterized protein n=1 Tax=Prorocentrum cordatum TaxID=2364126 RepID=A0ABN9V565_9DINO|nr:unnamed protein product [Polarella glacialis]